MVTPLILFVPNFFFPSLSLAALFDCVLLCCVFFFLVYKSWVFGT